MTASIVPPLHRSSFWSLGRYRLPRPSFERSSFEESISSVSAAYRRSSELAFEPSPPILFFGLKQDSQVNDGHVDARLRYVEKQDPRHCPRTFTKPLRQSVLESSALQMWTSKVPLTGRYRGGGDQGEIVINAINACAHVRPTTNNVEDEQRTKTDD